MMIVKEYLTIDETLSYLNKGNADDGLPLDYEVLENLAFENKLTPLVKINDDVVLTHSDGNKINFKVVAYTAISANTFCELKEKDIKPLGQFQLTKIQSQINLTELTTKPKISISSKGDITDFSLEETGITPTLLKVGDVVNAPMKYVFAVSDKDKKEYLDRYGITQDKIRFHIDELKTLTNQQDSYSNLQNQLTLANEKIEQLQTELAQVKEQLKAKALPTNDDILSDELTNVEIINIKKQILGKSNNLIAKAVKSLDISNILTKDDIAKFILPYSQEMVSFLNTISKSNQTTSIKTIKDKHLKNIAFKVGSPLKKEKEKVRIELIFDRNKLNTKN